MTLTLHDALREAADAIAGSDPRELDQAERRLYGLIDDRMFEIMDRLIELGEGAAEARACIQQAQVP